jgi:O-antigen/teichoic acid export membrane protein
VYAVQAAPVAFVGGSIADVFHARMARHVRSQSGRIGRLFATTCAMLLLLGLVPALIVMAFGPALFGWVFGERWTTAGQLAAVMAPWSLAALVVSPLSRVIPLLQAQELKFVYDTLALVGMGAAMLLATNHRFDLVEAIRLLSLTQVCAYVVYFVLLVHVVRRVRRP